MINACQASKVSEWADGGEGTGLLKAGSSHKSLKAKELSSGSHNCQVLWTFVEPMLRPDGNVLSLYLASRTQSQTAGGGQKNPAHPQRKTVTCFPLALKNFISKSSGSL